MYNRNNYRGNNNYYGNRGGGYRGGQRRQARTEREPAEFTISVGLPQASKYGDGQYQTIALKAFGETFFKVYAGVNQYGSYKVLNREDLENLYYAIGAALGLGQQQQTRQPKPQQRQQFTQQRQQFPQMHFEGTEENIEDNHNTGEENEIF